MHCAPEMSLDDTILADAEKNADAAIVVIGRTAGENEDVAFGEGDWYLSADERNMLGAVVSRFPGRTAVLVNSGGLIDFPLRIPSACRRCFFASCRVWKARGRSAIFSQAV